MRRHIILLSTVLSIVSCTVDDYNTVPTKSASVFDGQIETGLEVDLGLSAIWAGYNVGAENPSQMGGYYSWGEVQIKDDYSENTYSLHETLSAGQYLSKDNDVATQVLGYGWQIPSADDWQELAEKCTISIASYNGIVGYVATSKVEGYEGKSIFFPCAGYRAGLNINNSGSQAVYWANKIVDNATTRAINSFFTEVTNGSELRINMPPKGVGGLVWCGYPVRGIKKFNLNWNAEDCFVERSTTSIEIEITGNAIWEISATNGAVCSPSSGIGDGNVTISFSPNDTYDIKKYQVTLTSPEFTESKVIEISQFGVIPDFKFATEVTSVDWNTESCSLELIASKDVEWSGSVKYADGTEVEGASLSPSSGVGAMDLMVTIPSSVNIKDKTRYYVELVTTDTRIPELIRTISTIIEQDECELTPFGTVWGNSLLAAWNSNGFTANTAFTAETATVSVSKSLSNPGKDNGYMQGKFKFSFVVAQSGTGTLSFYVEHTNASHKTKVSVKRGSETVSSKDFTLQTINSRTKLECELTVQEGDVVTLLYNDSSNYAKLYCGKSYPISWTLTNN